MSLSTVDDRDVGLTPHEIAIRHGLSVSGARPGLIGYIRQTWGRRHFIVAFARAKASSAHSNAALGGLWSVLTPLMNAGVYYLIFGLLLGTSRHVDNFIPFLCAGVFIFGYTQQSVTTGAKAVSGNLGLIRALHFPRASLPLTSTITQGRNLLYSMIVLIAIVLATGESITVKWLLLIPALLLQTLFNAGLALGMARLASKITDLTQVLPFALRTWMYGSGVLYSLNQFIGHAPPALATVLKINPLAVYIELVRYALLADPALTSPVSQLWALAAGWALVFAVGGFIYFWRGEEEYGRG